MPVKSELLVSGSRRKRMLEQLRCWARALTRDVVAISIAARDPRIPWYVRAVAVVVAAYALSPIDLIPDFIPVFGYLDDLVIVPLGILLILRLIPPPLMAEFRAAAVLRAGQRNSYLAAGIIGLLWASAFGFVLWQLLSREVLSF